jgi:proline racemase
VKVAQEPIIRTYSGITSAEVEEAYRVDATRAADTGYLPISFEWQQTADGLALKVGYRLGGEAGIEAEPAPAEVEPVERAGPEPGTAVADRYAPKARSIAPKTAKKAKPAMKARAKPATKARAIPATKARAKPATKARASPATKAAAKPAAARPAPAKPAAARPAPAKVAVAEPIAPEPAAALHTGGRAMMTVTVVDLHCGGEPLRLVRAGFPDFPSLPAAERRQWAIEHADVARRAIIAEPRGHRDMYGALLLPPFSKDADHCVLFMHNEGWSTMCGHGIIAVTTALIEEGLHPANGPVTTIRYETPAGIVAANAATQETDGAWTVEGVRFTNVPAYVAERSLAIRPDGIALAAGARKSRALKVDLAFGGAFYGIVDAAELGLRVVPEQADQLRRAGAAITEVLRRDHTPAHPLDSSLGFVYGTIIVDRAPRTSPDGRAEAADLRNATIFADAELDRSPCGSGTSALLAQMHADGRLAVGQQIVSAGITGEYFLGRIEAATRVGAHDAVSTSIQGTAFVTGYSTLVVDARDPLAEGFLLGR